MANIILDDKKFRLLDFDSEDEFEKAVIANSNYLFGKDSIYIDVKKRFGNKDSYHKGIPDGYLIDFSSKKQPQLYFVENELSSHDVYSHISEQLLRFNTSIKTSQNQIRKKLLEVIKADNVLVKNIEASLRGTPFSNIDELMNFMIDKGIKIVVVIDEATADLNDSLDVFRERPDVVTMKRYIHKKEIAYIYEPMREELEDIETLKRSTKKDTADFDTIVCPAFEDGFKRAYMDNDAWWAIRISQKAREQLKYLAIYEKLPVAAVRHYAEIDRIEPYKDSGKFIVYLKNKKKIRQIELDRGKKGVAPQAPRFTTLNKLLKSKKISELWK
jgi:hypothetical protein